MAKRIVTKIGDVFSVPLDDREKKFFQYVAKDLTQLNSSVIRAFKRAYAIDDNPDLREVVSGEADFHAHVFLRWGIGMNLWQKVGHVAFDSKVDVWFRDSDDYGHPEIKTSYNWRVWKLNEEFRRVGKLEGEYQKAEIGVVVAAPHIVHRMRTGKYDFVYPGF